MDKMDEKEAVSVLESTDKDIPEYILIQLKPLVQSTFLPELKFGGERPFEDADFVNHREVIDKNLKTLTLVFKEMQTKYKVKLNIDVEMVQDVVLLCGENMKQELWTTKEILETAQTLLNIFVQILNFDCFPKLLFEFKSDFINMLLLKLRPKLLKDTWKRHPAAVACYGWLLFHIKSPYLSDYFDTVLPTALIILDDHEFRNRIAGMQCIEHIINNVTRTELNGYGKGILLYKALEPMVYFREPKLMPTLTSCLIALLTKTETDPSGVNLKWSHFDDVLNIWLPGMEMEQKIASRVINIECLCDFLRAAGLVSVRWSKKILRLLADYSSEKNTCKKSLETLSVFIDVTWPRIHHHCDSIFVMLMKIAMDLPELEISSESSEIVPLLKICFKKLKQASPDQVKRLCEEVSEIDDLKSSYCILTS